MVSSVNAGKMQMDGGGGAPVKKTAPATQSKASYDASKVVSPQFTSIVTTPAPTISKKEIGPKVTGPSILDNIKNAGASLVDKALAYPTQILGAAQAAATRGLVSSATHGYAPPQPPMLSTTEAAGISKHVLGEVTGVNQTKRLATGTSGEVLGSKALGTGLDVLGALPLVSVVGRGIAGGIRGTELGANALSAVKTSDAAVKAAAAAAKVTDPIKTVKSNIVNSKKLAPVTVKVQKLGKNSIGKGAEDLNRKAVPDPVREANQINKAAATTSTELKGLRSVQADVAGAKVKAEGIRATGAATRAEKDAQAIINAAKKKSQKGLDTDGGGVGAGGRGGGSVGNTGGPKGGGTAGGTSASSKGTTISEAAPDGTFTPSNAGNTTTISRTQEFKNQFSPTNQALLKDAAFETKPGELPGAPGYKSIAETTKTGELTGAPGYKTTISKPTSGYSRPGAGGSGPRSNVIADDLEKFTPSGTGSTASGNASSTSSNIATGAAAGAQVARGISDATSGTTASGASTATPTGISGSRQFNPTGLNINLQGKREHEDNYMPKTTISSGTDTGTTISSGTGTTTTTEPTGITGITGLPGLPGLNINLQGKREHEDNYMPGLEPVLKPSTELVTDPGPAGPPTTKTEEVVVTPKEGGKGGKGIVPIPVPSASEDMKRKRRWVPSSVV